MQLIKRTTLLYQEGRSDKVYEIDLCQTGEKRYVVNFRYGRRGTKLKEGSMTVQAVPLASAQRVFDKLVNSQIQKGYRDVSNQSVNEITDRPPVASPIASVTDNPRHQAILNCLSHQSTSKWSLSRAIWRAGELKIREATPLLIQLIGTGEPLRDYCIAAALGWCGDESAIATLDHLSRNTSTPEFVTRIAFEALLKLSDDQTQAALRSQKINQLPPELQELAHNGSASGFSTALRTYIEFGDYRHFAVLDTIYQIDNEYVRPALLDILRTAPLKPNYFQRIRHIFKIAEYRRDAEVFGIIAYRLEKEAAMFRSQWAERYYWDSASRRYRQIRDYLNSPEEKRAYNDKTRKYLRKRVWRTISQLGEEGDRDYVKMAVGILLQYSDADAGSARQATFYRWNYSNRTRRQFSRAWDSYSGYLTFNHILYENSPRYVLMPNTNAWRCRESYKPGDPEPEVPESAFPELWQQNPTALLQLLLESNCRPVHHFAVKALRVCQQFCAQVDVDTVIRLVNKPYEVTAQLGFELATERYNPANPNLELVQAQANCLFQPARTQAHRWIEAQRDRFLESSNFIAALVTSQHADTRQFARRLLSSSILSDSTARVLIGRIIAFLLALDPALPPNPPYQGGDTSLGEIAKEIGETMLFGFTPQLRNLGMGVILDLLRHPMPEIQELGARILLNHETSAADLPTELIDSLLNSPYEQVRGIGVRIFGQLPDETRLRRYELLVSIVTHELEDMRNAIRPVIRRLGSEHPDFASQLATELINVLMRKETHEGVHSYLVRLLREDLQGWMSGVTKQTALRLLFAKSASAQELGGLVLSANSDRWVSEFETSVIVKLASHEILSVREAAREMFEQILNRIHGNPEEMLAAVRLLEAKWDDSRSFANRIFSTCLCDADWDPEVMVSICDSVREDVRQFGRDLVTRHFRHSDGQDYLIKFSEHPSADMQMFATNYLENYAADNPDRLRELMPFFISVLSRVNRGRVAKQRIFAFLDAEAQKSEAAAQVVAEILTRQSLTIAIGDKATAIQTMLKIHRTYPHLALPIQVKLVSEVRS